MIDTVRSYVCFTSFYSLFCFLSLDQSANLRSIPNYFQKNVVIMTPFKSYMSISSDKMDLFLTIPLNKSLFSLPHVQYTVSNSVCFEQSDFIVANCLSLISQNLLNLVKNSACIHRVFVNIAINCPNKFAKQRFLC